MSNSPAAAALAAAEEAAPDGRGGGSSGSSANVKSTPDKDKKEGDKDAKNLWQKPRRLAAGAVKGAGGLKPFTGSLVPWDC